MPTLTFYIDFRGRRNGYTVDHSLTVTGTVPSANHLPNGLTFDGEHLWSATSGDQRLGGGVLLEIDPVSGNVVHTHAVAGFNFPRVPLGLAHSKDGLYLLSTTTGQPGGTCQIELLSHYGLQRRLVTTGLCTHSRSISYDGNVLYYGHSNMEGGVLGAAIMSCVNPKTGNVMGAVSLNDIVQTFYGKDLGGGIICWGDGSILHHGDTILYSTILGGSTAHYFEHFRVHRNSIKAGTTWVNANDGTNKMMGDMTAMGHWIACLRRS